MRHFLVVEDLTPQEIEGVFAISQDLETKYTAGVRDALFPGRVLALVFEKQSLRTRVSFQTAMVHLGGSSLFCLLYTSPSPRDSYGSRMPSSA